MSRKITLLEVGPRDGLQNERGVLSFEQKLEFIHLLEAAGHKRIEVGSFVNPAKVPQMSDSKRLFMALKKRPSIRYSVLVPNERGFEDALEAQVREIALFVGVSDSFNRKNIDADTTTALQRFAAFLPRAKKLKMFVRCYVSTAFGCPYEGEVATASVVSLCQKLVKLGVEELAISDTIGVASPADVDKLTRRLLTKFPAKRLAMHFHDTRGTALANVEAALRLGITTFDASAGGLGGCPYAPGASGNVATDDLLYMLHKMRLQTGVDPDKQRQASLFMQTCLGRSLPSRLLQIAQ